MKKILVVVAVLIAITFFCWFVSTILQHQEEASLERITYTGTVTAIVHGDYIDKVWFNSTPEVIKINGTIDLVIGEEYKITIDGLGNLINARILGGD